MTAVKPRVKACPFCGCPSQCKDVSRYGYSRYRVVCMGKCGQLGFIRNSKKKAIEAWNRRCTK